MNALFCALYLVVVQKEFTVQFVVPKNIHSSSMKDLLILSPTSVEIPLKLRERFWLWDLLPIRICNELLGGING